MCRAWIILSAVCLLVCGCQDVAQPSNIVTSPDGRIEVEVETVGDGVPCYSLTFGGEVVISESSLGIVTTEADFTSGLEVVALKHSSANSSWEPVWGERAVVKDCYNALSAVFKDSSNRELVVEFRLYDDGLGMRYKLQGEGSHYVTDEATTFRFVEDCEAHWVAGSYDDDEYAYMHTPMSGITLENMAQSSFGNRKLPYPSVNTPVTLITSRGTHVAIHEAALWDYPAMSLRYDGERNAFISDLASLQEVKAPVELPFVTPWRVVIVGDRAGALAESTIILNLNEPCRLADTSWIKPMKYVGVWWEMHLKLSTWDCDGAAPHCATTENVKRYIDFAAENGFGGVLVEGWNVGWGRDERFDYTMPYGDFDIAEIVAYGKERGVALIGHHETYANVENYEEQMEDAYRYYAEQGVPSVKTGYVGVIRDRLHNGYEMVNHYNWSVMEAAENHLMIDIHEPVHPSGICRTYPNLMSAEGMRGQEWQAWNSGNSIDHNPTLPFTRNLAGAMDFTPGIFDVRYHNTVNKAAKNEKYEVDPEHDYKFFVNSTLAHQLALYVVFYSPIQMVADLPDNYREHPKALEFIRNVPVDWAESYVPEAKVGDYCVTVRKDKHSENWYVGAITDDEPREVTLKFDYLNPNTIYEATIYRDGGDAGWNTRPQRYVVERCTVTKVDKLTLRMASGGGFAIELRPTE
ncbi:MAG: glycoside hydrolase family 97 protein [Alistipes sp.]|nr:glycoside hydrolase family 97 protein [Alistipes sp.]